MGVEPGDEASDDVDEDQDVDGETDAAGTESDEAGGEYTAADEDHLRDRLDATTVTFVDDLNADIAAVVDDAEELRFDYVVGDVSGPNVSSGGHLYFDLVHGDASVSCVVFGNRLGTASPDLEDGLQVAVKGDLSYYQERGHASVVVRDVVELGEGVYERTYRENRRVLEDDGLLDEDAKQPLPEFPRRIGLVTSAESDAREDAVTSVHARHPGVDVEIYNASVQGERAMVSMMEAISELDDDARIDVIVVTRGGGADKTLRVFNETPLCRVIANADTPVVVGVGHENDRVLAGEVADERVMTPTDVGEIVPDAVTLDGELSTAGDRLAAAYASVVRATLADLDAGLSGAYESFVERDLRRRRSALDRAYETVATERVTALERRLDHALRQREQTVQHEQATAKMTAAHRRTRRRQRLVIATLVVLLLLALAYALL